MLRRFFPTPTDDAPDEADPTASSVAGPGTSGEPDLAALPIVGITRRRAAIMLGALLAGWIIILFARQVSEACGWEPVPDYLVRDRDRVYGQAFTRRIRAMGIRDRPTAPRSPWQNGYAERLIGSIRRECLDHVMVFGERHLRHVLGAYQQYYNGTRTHLALAKDSPLKRSVQAIGSILPLPILGGLHHHYVRI